MYSGMAARMALELGLNKEPDLENKPVSTQSAERWMNQEVHRRVFWNLFSLDKYVRCRFNHGKSRVLTYGTLAKTRFMSASTGRPSIFQEEDCEVLLPTDDDGWSKGQFYTESVDRSRVVLFNVQALRDSNLLGVSASVDPALPLNDANGASPQLSTLAQLYRGSALLGRVTSFINRGSRTKKMLSYGPGSEFALLDKRIDDWYASIPSHFRFPSPVFEDMDNKDMSVEQCRFIMVRRTNIPSVYSDLTLT